MPVPVMTVGLIVGTFALLSVCWVWIRKQTFGIGGGALGGFGVFLIAMSVVAEFNVRISPDGVELEVIRQQVAQAAAAAAEVGQQTQVVANALDIHRTQLLALTDVLQQSHSGSPFAMRAMRNTLAAAPRVDIARLEAATASLSGIRNRVVPNP